MAAGHDGGRRRALGWIAAAAAAGLAPARAFAADAADPAPVVVELFTSQGCSSCPPADALLGELAATPGVVALTFNVDYWDYLGWSDRLAKPEHSDRQRAYVRALGETTVFTPQMFIDGAVSVVGSRRDEVLGAIAARRADPMRTIATAALSIADAQLAIDLAPTTPIATPCRVLLVGLERRRDEAIGRGENAGATIAYHNVVREMRDLGAWPGAAARRMTAPLTPSLDAYAALLHSGPAGRIVGAGFVAVAAA